MSVIYTLFSGYIAHKTWAKSGKSKSNGLIVNSRCNKTKASQSSKDLDCEISDIPTATIQVTFVDVLQRGMTIFKAILRSGDIVKNKSLYNIKNEKLGVVHSLCLPPDDKCNYNPVDSYAIPFDVTNAWILIRFNSYVDVKPPMVLFQY